MERLTDKRGARSWFLFHLGWYLNLLLFLAAISAAIYFFMGIMSGSSNEVYDSLMMMSFVILSAILLMGAGISRYQARLEGQHLEIKKTILALGEKVDMLRAAESKRSEAVRL
ncbi:MAG: hypothetical protein EHM61_14690 [Acidobacteria bacterium]|nr:MAG: hypothetical protein EHM61_14690 [Acidobacteriota bacterium]